MNVFPKDLFEHATFREAEKAQAEAAYLAAEAEVARLAGPYHDCIAQGGYRAPAVHRYLGAVQRADNARKIRDRR